MQERVWVLTGGAGPTLATFHGFCARLLRIEAPAIGRRVDFTIYDSSDALDLVKAVAKDLAIDDDLASPWALMDHLSSKRNARPDEPHTWTGKRWPTVDEDIARFEKAYAERLASFERVRLRRTAHRIGAVTRNVPRRPRTLAQTIDPRPRRRIPRHELAPVPIGAPPHGDFRQSLASRAIPIKASTRGAGPTRGTSPTSAPIIRRRRRSSSLRTTVRRTTSCAARRR
jgi:hypothetical protein